jgi:hypothetical protein
VADAVDFRSPGRRPDEYASRTPLAPFWDRPTSRSISSSGISEDSDALPDIVNARAVGNVKMREIVVSGSLRGGYPDVRERVITRLKRSAAEAAPRSESILVGISSNWRTDCPGISISEKPTAAAVSGGAVLSVVPSSMTRSVWNVRSGKVSVCPLVR